MIDSKSFGHFDANDADNDEDDDGEEEDEYEDLNQQENEYTSHKVKQSSILTGKRYSSSCNQLLKCLSNSLDDHDHPNDLLNELNLTVSCMFVTYAFKSRLIGSRK